MGGKEGPADEVIMEAAISPSGDQSLAHALAGTLGRPRGLLGGLQDSWESELGEQKSGSCLCCPRQNNARQEKPNSGNEQILTPRGQG